MDLGLTGHAIVVTGATSGIGRAAAVALAGEGARLLLVARGEEGLARTAAELPGGPHAALSADVAEPASGATIVAACREAHGRLDALVLAAGTSRDAPPHDLTPEDWDLQWRINVLGPHALLLAAADDLADAPGGGRAVLVSSSSGKRPSASNMAYSVGKAAQLSLSRAWAQELAPRGVRVNAVTPGPIDSEMWLAPGGLAEQVAERRGTTKDEALEGARARVPLGRFGTPEEIADVLVLLASPRAGFAVGGAWSADGGSVATIV
ncbi:SDR family NAD(P)-dependent oxidoreductase [Patulibacter sp.]|uniref:SDR family NAD(P)-dependent oxidoreductase n=1 Tax=Patulibacter sp. TaxID=1912859 RepID=UPI002728FE70|nr:SDR family oxidoreductase [Patulibacter sp.]MDO9408749.1 SDR family oxidoreductase [Patulibacter sp.]